MDKVEKKGPVIVAMKGRTCTGKSTLALALTKAIKCPLIDYDDVYACTATVHRLLLDSNILNHRNHNLLDELSYDAVFQIAWRQISLPHPLTLVIDSPLSDKSHLTRLRELASSCSARLCIIECKPENEPEWRRRLEERSANEILVDRWWYKPSNWEQLQLASPEYYDDDDEQVYDVPRIVIDTTSLVKIQVHVAAVLKFIGLETEEGDDNGDDDDDHVSTTVEKGNIQMKILLDKHQHSMTLYNVLKEGEEGTVKYPVCSYCNEYVSRPIYSCAECTYTLHKICAEFPLEIQVPVHNHPLSLLPSRTSDFCVVCGDRFRFGYPLYECETCNLKIHPKCGLASTKLTHGLHIHPLDFKMYPFNVGFPCLICARRNNYASYSCVECGFHIHPWCALLPLMAKHERHLHILTLASPTRDDSDDEYYCNACEELRDPNQYVYYCDYCEFASHLTCIHPLEYLDPIAPSESSRSRPVEAQWVDIHFPEAAS